MKILSLLFFFALFFGGGFIATVSATCKMTRNCKADISVNDATAANRDPSYNEVLTFETNTATFYESTFDTLLPSASVTDVKVEASSSVDYPSFTSPITIDFDMVITFSTTSSTELPSGEDVVLAIFGANFTTYANDHIKVITGGLFDEVQTAEVTTSGQTIISGCADSPTASPSSPTEAPEEDDGGGGGGGACFSGDMSVQVQNRGDVPLHDLTIGDLVLVAQGTYEPVYGFGHYLAQTNATTTKAKTTTTFLQIYTDEKNKKPLEMTPDHLVYVQKKQHKDKQKHTNNYNSNIQALRADQLEVGDQLITDIWSTKPIININKAEKKTGLYMPLTKSGSIVVNGILASTYVSFSDRTPEVSHHPLIHGWLSEHGLMHLWLTPYRMYCMGVLTDHCALPTADKHDGILNYLAYSESLATFANRQPFLLQTFMGMALLILFGTLYLAEVIVGPALAPALFFFCLGLVVRLHDQNRKQEKKAAGSVWA